MLKGFNYLLTPKERSTLKQSPPWYYFIRLPHD